MALVMRSQVEATSSSYAQECFLNSNERRQRFRSVDEENSVDRLNKNKKFYLGEENPKSSFSYEAPQNTQQLRKSRGSTGLSTAEYESSEEESDSDFEEEEEEENVDNFDESCMSCENVQNQNLSVVPSLSYSCRNKNKRNSKSADNQELFLFPRKSSYILRKPTQVKTGGLAKLLQQVERTPENMEKDFDADGTEPDAYACDTRQFGFRNCVHCAQIFACESNTILNDSITPSHENSMRQRYCSGECHLTHLSALIQKQRQR